MSRTSTHLGPARLIAAIRAAPRKVELRIEKGRARFGWFDVAFRTFKRYGEDDAGSYAAALTYYTFFAVFPLLLFGAAALGYITFGNERLSSDIIDKGISSVPLLRDALTPQGLDLIQRNRDAIAGTGLLLALYAGTGVIVALEHALNKINHVADEGNWFAKRFRAVKWLVLLGVAAVASFGMTTAGEASSGILLGIVTFAGGFAINLFIFTSAFKFLSSARRPWREVLPGAAVAAAVFEALKTFGAAYLASGEAMRNDTFGTLAGAATLLVASYLISQVTLLSAEVNAALTERREARTMAAERTEGAP